MQYEGEWEVVRQRMEEFGRKRALRKDDPQQKLLIMLAKYDYYRNCTNWDDEYNGREEEINEIANWLNGRSATTYDMKNALEECEKAYDQGLVPNFDELVSGCSWIE